MAPIQGRNEVSTKTVKGGVARRVVLAVTVLAIGIAAALPTASAGADPPGQLVEVQLLAFNDYHGHLEADTLPGRVIVAGAPAGGGEYLSTKLRRAPCRQEVQPHRRGRRPDRRVAVPVGPVPRRAVGGVARTRWASTSRASATTSSTRASPSCCACRTVAATRSTAATSRTHRTPGADFQWLAANTVDERGQHAAAAVLDQERSRASRSASSV